MDMYVGRKDCGCITAAAYADQHFDLLDFTKRMSSTGRSVDKLPKEQALSALSFDCPHERSHDKSLSSTA